MLLRFGSCRHYWDKESFEALEILFNEGINVRSIQSFIDDLDNTVNNIFPSATIPVKISGIKAGNVKVIDVIDGKKEEVARIVKGELEKKKFIAKGDIVGDYKGNNILKNGEEVGFGNLYNAGSDLLKRFEDLGLSSLVKKLDEIGVASKAKFLDDFTDASDYAWNH